MKKMVVMMDAYGERSKERIIQTVATCSGVTTISMDSKDGKLTVIGELNTRRILTKLERRWRNAKMVSFGPYDPKKEAETAAAAEKKKKEESEREVFDALYKSCRENPSLCFPMHHHTSVCDHDQCHGCIIS